ncbi:GTPase Era, mitochondrial [Hypsibius exemplaris]|uniref:GTPase Era, mitochondrial n=1 Tax=Hypsibius exemplaris TaxID=2072580 RepID=A0A1W0WLX2_HYPEX|nr:GTPase Era, mitochondrial [Hypsibius exemplaris]
MPFLGRYARNYLGLLVPGLKHPLRRVLQKQLLRPVTDRQVCWRCQSSSVSHAVRTEVTVEDDDATDEITTDAFNEEVLDRIPDQEPMEPMFWDRKVPRTMQESKSLIQRPTTQVANPKFLRVSILGSPNAGKSTLVNQILGWRVCSTSSKVHTTRRNSLAIMTEENVQIVLVDTPGVIAKENGNKHHLERSLITDPEASVPSVDVLAVLVDASMRYSENGLDPLILSLLYKNPYKDAILLLNKVDLIKKKGKLLELSRTLTNNSIGFQSFPRHEPVETHLSKAQKNQLFSQRYYARNDPNYKPPLTPEEKFWADIEKFNALENSSERKVFLEKKRGWSKFKEVFMISALDGDGISELKSYFLRSAYSANWKYNPELVSNQSPKEIVLLAVREKLLEHLRMKLPYQIELFLKEWQIDEKGVLRLCVRVKCPRPGAMKIVMGEGANRIRAIAYEAGQEMMNTFRCEVLLKLVVCSK